MWLESDSLASLLSLAGDPSVLRSLTESVNTDLDFERQLRAARRLLLDAYSNRDPRLQAFRPLIVALGHQAFNNEYVVAAPESELARVPAPEEQLGGLSPASMAAFEWAVGVSAMYRAVPASIASGPDAVPLERFSADVRPLIHRTLLEPAREAQIGASIVSLGSPADDTSMAVRRIYERHPYPRWFQVTPSGKSIHDEIVRFRPGAVTRPPRACDILIAGCGTGHHAIRVALDNPDADVVGLDFSRAALGYAARMAGDLGVRNVAFVHGDLLDLDRLGRSFHHIECGGVLHHIRERDQAWRRLCQVLEPGGTLKVGLYSRAGRLHIEHLRTIFKLSGDADVDQIRTLRARMIETPSVHALVAQVARSRDFFTTSMVRDLLFHVYERPYSVQDVQSIAAAHGLALLGVTVPRPVRQAVEQRDPNAQWPVTTFARWKAIEWAYAGTAVMLRFWLQKQE